MLINRKQTVTQAVCRDWIILCLSLLNKLLSKFNQTHQALSVSLREAVISVAEAGDENKAKTKNNTTNKNEKTVSVFKVFRELFVWHRELPVFRKYGLIECNWYLSTESFKLLQRAASSMGPALWKLQPTLTRILNNYHTYSTSLPSLARLICF